MTEVPTTRQKRVRANIIVILLGLLVALSSGLAIAIFPQAVYVIPVVLLLAAVLLLLSQRPDRGLLLSVFLIVVQRSPDLPIIGLLTISEIALILAVVIWLAQNVRRQRKIEVYAPGLLGPFLVYILASVASLLTSFSYGDMEIGVSELLARIYLMISLVIVATYTTQTHKYRRVLLAWVASAFLVIGLTALYLFFENTGYYDPIGLEQDGVMFMGLYKYSTGLAGYLVGTILAFLPLALSRRPSKTFRPVQVLARWCLPGLLLALLLTDSQAAYLGLMLGVMAWPFIRFSKPLGVVLVIVAVVASTIALVFAPMFLDSENLFTQALSAIGYPLFRLRGRTAMLELRFGAISAQPVTGIGLGQIAEYVSYVTGTRSEVSAHFTPIEIFVETGLLGLLAVSFGLLTYFKVMWNNAALSLTADQGWLRLHEGLTMAFLGMFAFGLAHDIQTNRTFWLILALIVSLKPASLSAASCLRHKGQTDDWMSSLARDRSGSGLAAM